MNIEIIPFGVRGSSRYKATHLHYCGYYSNTLLAHIVQNVVVVENENFVVSENTAIDWAYDGHDTIITEKRLVYTIKEWPIHTPIYNIHKQLVGIVTYGVQQSSKTYCYAIQDGFRLFNCHLSNLCLVVREKTKKFVYADKQFDMKEDLVRYVHSLLPSYYDANGAILYHTKKFDTQLVLHQGNQQISIIQLRRPIFGAV